MKKNRLKRTLATGLALSMALTIGVSASAKTLTLPNSGYTLEVGDAAPEKSANANSIGGNTQLFHFDDFSDLAAYPEAEEAVNWWLSSGVTNGGKTFTTFGADDPFYRYDLAFFLYRYYGIVNDDGMWFYDDVPINQAGSVVGMKFNDAVTNVRWSGIMNGVGALSAEESATGEAGENCFDPYGYVTTEQLLITLYRLINYQDGTTANPEFPTSTTMQVNSNFDITVSLVSDEEADEILGDDVIVSTWAKPYVAAMVQAGLYTPAAGEDLTVDMKKVDLIQVLYDVCAGTGGVQQMTDGFMTIGDNTVVYDEDAQVTGETFSNGDADSEATDETILVVRNGADVTLTDSTIQMGNMAASNPYPLAYRWGHAVATLVYGEDSILTLKDCVIDFQGTFGHQTNTGLTAYAGGTILVDSCDFNSPASGLLCYNGTIIYKDSALTGSDRINSSDFFSGIVVYDNTTVNEGTDTIGGAFADEAATTYVVGSDYFGAGSGNQTGISTFYGYDSTLKMSPTNCTNNTSMLSDVTSLILEDCSVEYPSGIASVVREGKFVAQYINCGEIQLGELAEDEYDISISGTEFGSYAAARIYLDGSTFSRPLKVYVADGCTLEIFYTGDTAPVVEQDTSVVRTIQCYANTAVLPSVDAANTGSVTVTQMEG